MMGAYEAPGQSDDWHTPAYIFESMEVFFDLDVAAPRTGPRHVPCSDFYFERSLDLPWKGFVWMNPPFGHQRTKTLWLKKFFDHANGIALMPDRTSAPWWQEFSLKADAILFIAPKIKFEREDGSIGKSPGTGTVLFAKGKRAVDAIRKGQENGLGVVAYPHPDVLQEVGDA